jgi:hypothetical protein
MPEGISVEVSPFIILPKYKIYELTARALLSSGGNRDARISCKRAKGFSSPSSAPEKPPIPAFRVANTIGFHFRVMLREGTREVSLEQ